MCMGSSFQYFGSAAVVSMFGMDGGVKAAVAPWRSGWALKLWVFSDTALGGLLTRAYWTSTGEI